MPIIRWAAVAVTALFSLMNIGTFTDKTVPKSLVLLALVFGVVGLVAAVGLALKKSWGRAAVIGIGVVNVVAAIVALVNGIQEGWIGVAVGALGAVLGLLTKSDA